MGTHKVGYARVSTAEQDLTVQRESLVALGVTPNLIFTDHGLTGRNRDRPGLERALTAVREGDTFVVTKLDRLARSIPDARDIAEELTAKGVALSIGGSVYDPSDPVGKLLFNVLSMVAEFESDIIRARTREGMAVAKAKGKLKGRQSSVSEAKRKHLIELVERGAHTKVEIAEMVGISRATLYREIEAHRARQVAMVASNTVSGLTLGELFRSMPDYLGLRGNPVLWEKFREEFATMPIPDTSREVEELVAGAVERWTGLNPLSDEVERMTDEQTYVYVRELDPGHGISGGYVHVKWWRSHGIPHVLLNLAPQAS